MYLDVTYYLSLSLPYLTFGAGRLLLLPSAEAMSVQPNVHPLKVKVAEGYVNSCEAEIDLKPKINQYISTGKMYNNCLYTVFKKTVKIGFCHNFVKFPPSLIIFGTKMAKTIELCNVHSFTASPNLCQRTTM